MNRFFSTLTTLAWGLWLGGLAFLFVAIVALFRGDRALATQVAPYVFKAFQRYEGIVTAVAIVGGVGWRFLDRSLWLNLVLSLLILAAIGSVVSPLMITPRMYELWEQQQSHLPEFKRLHGMSSLVFTIQAGLLLLAGLMLPTALRGRGSALSQTTVQAR